jgi:hypothetical protein
VHVRRGDEPPNGRVDDQQRDEEEREAVALCGEDLRASEAERPRAPRGTRCQRRSDERGHERGRIGQHVAGVGEEGERVRDEAGGDLPAHEREDQRERGREALAVSVVRVQGAPVESGA